jgi:hypothetical protein
LLPKPTTLPKSLGISLGGIDLDTQQLRNPMDSCAAADRSRQGEWNYIAQGPEVSRPARPESDEGPGHETCIHLSKATVAQLVGG